MILKCGPTLLAGVTESVYFVQLSCYHSLHHIQSLFEGWTYIRGGHFQIFILGVFFETWKGLLTLLVVDFLSFFVLLYLFWGENPFIIQFVWTTTHNVWFYSLAIRYWFASRSSILRLQARYKKIYCRQAIFKLPVSQYIDTL